MRIDNKKARFDYDILDRMEAGVALSGAEVKSLRTGKGKLTGAFVRFIDGTPTLVNAEIPRYPYASAEGYDPKRSRKLLIHKAEILSLQGKVAGANLTIVPLAWYTTGHRVKLSIGLARGKKEYEKREKIKKEDMRRDLEREFRGKVK
jgi:SsrA-binding protein